MPIGVFDSGVGGLTVLKAIRELMPSEDLVYLGDTARLPYGTKSPASIARYASQAVAKLQEEDIKLLVIACNTASASAFAAVKKQVGNRALVINVIDPVVRYVAEHHLTDKVGVIGTKGTINSRVYVRKLQAKSKKLRVVSQATPLLAPMIEEGFFNNYISRTVIHSYLSRKAFLDINALILACTHYPLIKKEVKEYYGPAVDIVDSAEIVAQEVRARLEKKGLINPAKRKPGHRFYVSDFTASFEESTRYFFKDQVHLKKLRFWGE